MRTTHATVLLLLAMAACGPGEATLLTPPPGAEREPAEVGVEPSAVLPLGTRALPPDAEAIAAALPLTDAGQVEADAGGLVDSGDVPDSGQPATDGGEAPDAGQPPPPPPPPAVTTERPLGSTSASYGFVEYLPAGYSTTGAAWPVLIVLHGIGEEGDGTTQLSSVRRNGPNDEIDNKGKAFPMVILTPQSPGWWDSNALDAFVTFALANYNVDARRVYLTGLSMGGGGTWDYASQHAGRLAAIVPICGASGGGNDANAAGIVAQGVGVWAAHAVNDSVVGYWNSVGWISAIGHDEGAAGQVTDTYPAAPQPTQTAHLDPSTKTWLWADGQVDAAPDGTPFPDDHLFTVYTSGDHWIWGRMYSDPELYRWLLRHSRP